MPRKVILVPGSTKKICQLTGETDRQEKHPAFNQTETRYGLRGTDLGATFEHKGRVCVLFGDTHPNGPNNDLRLFDGDCLAFSRDKDGEKGMRLDFVVASDGKYATIQAPGVSLRGFEVPTGGVSHNDQMYVFCTTDVRIVPGTGVIMGRSVLLRSRDDGKTFQMLHSVSRDKIIYVTPVPINNRSWKGVPATSGRGLLLFAGSTEYRRSNPYLAYQPLDEIESPQSLRYFAGLDAGKMPTWSTREADAKALFELPAIGENCVTYNTFLKQWVMVYNCDARPGPRGIHLRTADMPWGPWSEPEVIFEPTRDKGYGYFMHRADPPGPADGVNDPGREREWGGEYGPYIVDRFTRGNSKETTIYYILSTWNPYNTVLMKSTLRVV